MNQRRLFFGFGVKAPWPSFDLKGRILPSEARHLTAAFLGNSCFDTIERLLPSMPLPPFKIGPLALFDECLFLPQSHPRVVAYHVKDLEKEALLLPYIQELLSFLEENGLELHTKPFCPHVTLAGSFFSKSDWEKQFIPLPLFLSSFHLYESLGHSRYQKLWGISFMSPFEEIEHTADLAFSIYGTNLKHIDLSSQMALCFQSPRLTSYLDLSFSPKSLEEIIMHLNDILYEADREEGVPFKAVSFHGHLEEKDHLLKWEMIVDV